MFSVAVIVALQAVKGQSQQTGPLEITSSTFNQAMQMPVAWLLQLESSWSTHGRATASLLQPSIQQVARYYNVQHKGNGVRVGHIDMQQTPELRSLFCDSNVCPSLILYHHGLVQARCSSTSLRAPKRAAQ